MTQRRLYNAYKWARLPGKIVALCPYHLRLTGAPSVRGDGTYICGLCNPSKAIVILPVPT